MVKVVPTGIRGLVKKVPTSRTDRAGLKLPVGRIHRNLKKGRFAERISKAAPIYMAAVMEYLTAEVLEVAGNVARERKKKRIQPRDLQLAIRNDDELDRLWDKAIIPNGGVVEHIHKKLLPKTTKTAAGGGGEKAKKSTKSTTAAAKSSTKSAAAKSSAKSSKQTKNPANGRAQSNGRKNK